jgi:hypothetical protein
MRWSTRERAWRVCDLAIEEAVKSTAPEMKAVIEGSPCAMFARAFSG